MKGLIEGSLRLIQPILTEPILLFYEVDLLAPFLLVLDILNADYFLFLSDEPSSFAVS